MRLINLLTLLPLIAAAPAKPSIPELSIREWTSIQSGFVDGLRQLTDWSWSKAEDLVEEIEQLNKDDETELTIWQQLKADPNSFSKLVKVIEFEEKAIKYLDDKDAQITFFAPNNDALHSPHHHHHHDDDDDDDDDDDLMELAKNPSLATVSAALDADVSLLSDDKDDDDKKERRKEIFKFIVGKVLAYHGIPKAYTAAELAQNSTFATALKADDGSYGGLHRRIKIEKTLIPPAVKINFYAKLLVTDKKARNGYLHTLDAPLIPPPSIFEIAYLFPDFYSTLTSAIQGLHARKYLDWQYDHEDSKPGHPAFKGTGLVTLFAPVNSAFVALPQKLKLYLFSPFGEKALAKILMYHSIPETLLLSELLYKEKKAITGAWGFSDAVEAMEHFNIADDPSFHKEFDVHTALPNSTLHIEIDKSKILPIEGAVKISIKVNGQTTLATDVQARNGAFHPIGKLLIPPHKHHDHHGEDISSEDSWENWEEWLPAFADEE